MIEDIEDCFKCGNVWNKTEDAECPLCVAYYLHDKKVKQIENLESKLAKCKEVLESFHAINCTIPGKCAHMEIITESLKEVFNE